MKKFQESIATTITAIVVVSMAVGFSLRQVVDGGRILLGFDRNQIVRTESSRLASSLEVQIADLIQMLDSIPNSERAAAIAASQHPQLQVTISDAPMVSRKQSSGVGAPLLRYHIETLLSSRRVLIVSTNFKADDGQTGLFVETPLSDGHWLLFRADLQIAQLIDFAVSQTSRVSFVAWLILFILFAVLLSALAARRLGKPLSELYLAAEQLGGGAYATPLIPRGPREVQATFRAFNRMQERIRRFNDDRTRMLAAMSHDLKTPITRLQLRLEAVEDTAQRDKMLAELKIMNEMVESTLSFAREDTKHESPSLVDLGALVEGICEDATDTGAEVVFSGPRGVTISCRPTAIRRAVSNLVDNAVKYGGCADVSLSSEAQGAVLLVEDRGPGIPRSEREKVFEPFYRIERSRNLGTGGVGLGLAVTRSVIWEHGGDIKLVNRKGGGLSVRVQLLESSVVSRRLSANQGEPLDAILPSD